MVCPGATLLKPIGGVAQFGRALRSQRRGQGFKSPHLHSAGYVIGDVNTQNILVTKDALVTIIEFSDFQCPFCGRYTRETAPGLRAEFVDTGIASIEYRHLAILGPESQRAAEAAECALEQGFFWEYHDILFRSSRPTAARTWARTPPAT